MLGIAIDKVYLEEWGRTEIECITKAHWKTNCILDAILGLYLLGDVALSVHCLQTAI